MSVIFRRREKESLKRNQILRNVYNKSEKSMLVVASCNQNVAKFFLRFSVDPFAAQM